MNTQTVNTAEMLFQKTERPAKINWTKLQIGRAGKNSIYSQYRDADVLFVIADKSIKLPAGVVERLGSPEKVTIYLSPDKRYLGIAPIGLDAKEGYKIDNSGTANVTRVAARKYTTMLNMWVKDKTTMYAGFFTEGVFAVDLHQGRTFLD